MLSFPGRVGASLVLLLPGVAFGGDALPHKAVLVSLQAGDTACHIELSEPSGMRSALAGFTICEQGEAWLGQPVRFSWTQGAVAAADCEGDVDCGRSETVMLIDRMLREPEVADCGAGEDTAFRCAVGGKQVAVCHSAVGGTGWLQYRFGRPGRAPELVTPEFPLDPPRAAEGRVETYAGGGASWLRFRRGDHAYVVYTGIGRWGPDGATRDQAGVVVERHAEVIADLRCTGPIISELGPDWFERVGVEAGADAEFVIPGI